MKQAEKELEVYRIAKLLYAQPVDWTVFYREILGLGGIVRRMYRTPAALAKFEQTEAYQKIQQMLRKLREKEPLSGDNPDDPTSVVTIRLPKSLRDALLVEALEHGTSMNKLCISKLLQIIDRGFVPDKSRGLPGRPS